MPLPNTPKQATEQRQASLVSGALALAAQHRPARVTTAALARAVGLTQGAVFRHFERKVAIWLAVIDFAHQVLLARLQTAAQSHVQPLTALRAVFMAHVDFVVEQPCVPRVIFQELQHPEDTALKARVRVLIGQIMALLRNDPRVPIARRTEIRTDVFLGVVVDCSGSMQCSGRIERAQLFAALIAEAVRGMASLDLRLFGFTDQVIYDAGDANACAAHRLTAGGGNNDAAALLREIHLEQATFHITIKAVAAQIVLLLDHGTEDLLTPEQWADGAAPGFDTALAFLKQNNRARMPMSVASAFKAAWEDVCCPAYQKGEINNECTLHAMLYAELRARLPRPKYLVLCEPQLDNAVPDIVVLDTADQTNRGDWGAKTR